MLFYLEKFTNIVCLWDESGSFMGAFGRYSGGGSSALAYERSIFLELANSPRDFRRDLKQGRCCIKNPRLNLCLNGK